MKVLTVHRYIKLGTMPGDIAYVRLPAGGAKQGMRVEVQHDGKWVTCIIDKIGPWPEGRLFLSLL